MRRAAVLLTLLAVAAAGPAEAAAAPAKKKPACVTAKAKAKAKKKAKRPAAKSATRKPAAKRRKKTCRKPARRKPAVTPPKGAPSPPSRPAPTLPAAPVSPAIPTTAPPAPPAYSTLGAEAHDIDGTFVLRMTKVEVPAGALTVYFRNVDSSLHNLSISSPGGDRTEISGDIPRDAAAQRTLPVAPGSWTLFCTLPGHGSMTRTLTVR